MDYAQIIKSLGGLAVAASTAAGASTAVALSHGKEKKTKAAMLVEAMAEEAKADSDATTAIEETWDEEEWQSHPKSNMVKWMMDRAQISVERLSRYLGCKPQSLRNKMFRDSFSIDDLVATSYACGFTITFLENEAPGRGEEFLVIDPELFFEKSNPAALDRLKAADDKEMAEKEARYRKLVAELKEMQSELGIEE
ncbi:MAG: hypothetical protein ACOYD7_02910 [Raoultibacter sp.]|jgi:hypothetical protein